MIASRRSILAGLGVSLIARPTHAARIIIPYDLSPTFVRTAEAESFSNVQNWGGQGARAGQMHSIAFVANVTGYSMHTRTFSPDQARASKAGLYIAFDGQFQLRLSSMYYGPNGVVWDDNWHTPLTPNPAAHPNAQTIAITDKFNAMVDDMNSSDPERGGGYSRQLMIDVGPQADGQPGTGRVYMARLVLWHNLPGEVQ